MAENMFITMKHLESFKSECNRWVWPWFKGTLFWLFCSFVKVSPNLRSPRLVLVLDIEQNQNQKD